MAVAASAAATPSHKFHSLLLSFPLIVAAVVVVAVVADAAYTTTYEWISSTTLRLVALRCATPAPTFRGRARRLHMNGARLCCIGENHRPAAARTIVWFSYRSRPLVHGLVVVKRVGSHAHDRHLPPTQRWPARSNRCRRTPRPAIN